MANSISINSDMTKLIFTSSSGTSEFDLSEAGVILKLTGGDVSADPTTSPIPGDEIEVTTVNSQWTVTFNEVTKLLFFIGIEDIDTGMVAHHQFELSEKIVNIRRVESTLIVSSSV